MEKLRVAAYARTSTDQEKQEGSFQLQKQYFKDMIEADPNLELVDIYGDFGKSGRMAENRPDFQRMIRDCEAGKIDVIYTKSVSRFARNVTDMVETIRHLRDLGVTLYFEKEGLNTSDIQAELLLNILGIVAQEESRSFGENVRLGLELRVSTGHPVGMPSYGYRRIDKEANWDIVGEEAKRVRLAFRMAGEGNCYADIRKALDQLEGEEGTGQTWQNNRVRRMLTNVSYVGDVLTGKSYTVYGKKKQHKINHGERPQYLLEQHHQPIVTRELFDRVQLLMELGLLHSRRWHMTEEEKALLQDESWRGGQDQLEKKSA